MKTPHPHRWTGAYEPDPDKERWAPTLSEGFKQHGVVIGGKKYVTNDYGKFVLVEEEDVE